MGRAGVAPARRTMSAPLSPEHLRAPEPSLPDQIGKYRVLSKLGEGATSEVFLARDEFRNQNVAIKRVRTSLLADSRENHFQQHFFAAEAALVGRLQHPNIVRILDVRLPIRVGKENEPPPTPGLRREGSRGVEKEK